MIRALAAWTLVWSAIVCARAEAAEIGPPAPPPVSSPEAWRFRDATASLRTQAPEVPVPRLTPELGEEETIERVSGEERGPRIPEPMVFDLVRPLGVKRGEWEANTLALFPLRPRSRRADDTPDPLGLVRRSRDRRGVEWAPEIEYAFADGSALELELPMEDAALEAFKAAGQTTFGTAFSHRFIHGAQAILQYDRDPALWTATLLYLAGWRVDETWSIFGMAGARGEVAGNVPARRAEWLTNLTLFADLTPRWVAGVEMNLSQVIGGDTSLLIMPQLHYEAGRHWMLQAGAGVRVTTDLAVPEIGLRVIREF
jgi:hypothetical protein